MYTELTKINLSKEARDKFINENNSTGVLDYGFKFRDANGVAHIIIHGIKTPLLGTCLGLNLKSPKSIYKSLLKEGFIKNGEKLVIVCCYGKGVKNNSPYCEILNNTPNQIYVFTTATLDNLNKTSYISVSVCDC